MFLTIFQSKAQRVSRDQNTRTLDYAWDVSTNGWIDENSSWPITICTRLQLQTTTDFKLAFTNLCSIITWNSEAGMAYECLDNSGTACYTNYVGWWQGSAPCPVGYFIGSSNQFFRTVAS